MISGVYSKQYLASEVTQQPSIFSTNTRPQPHNTLGEMRYNSTSNVMEYCNGVAWVTVPTSYVTFSLDPNVCAIIEWAKKKMIEESLQSKLAKYPSIKAAYDQFKMLDALTNEEHLDNGT